jgi:predicted nucleic acid-binding protein
VNVVDSSAWLEYFSDGPNAAYFAKPIENTKELLVPSLSLYEVYKRVLQQRGDSDALQVIAVMQQGRLVDLDGNLALQAARLSRAHGLPLADSVMLATARAFDAVFWTQGADFKDLPGVQFRATRR